MSSTVSRCAWATSDLLAEYHDREWGDPVHDDRKHFEFLILEGAQAGLSWETVLKRREGYRSAYAGFDPVQVAAFGVADAERLLQDARIIRNRAKVAASIENARRFLEVQKEFGSFDAYLWGFVGGKTIQNAWNSLGELPAKTPESEALSKDLMKHGFRFVGPTIMYAHMQAAGLVNDHTVDCFRWEKLSST
jgi:DNA-3-methyladenine glycosylase I